MTANEIIRAWKNPKFRSTLSSFELDSIPENPAGIVELTDIESQAIRGGGDGQGVNATCGCLSFGCCPVVTTACTIQGTNCGTCRSTCGQGGTCGGWPSAGTVGGN